MFFSDMTLSFVFIQCNREPYKSLKQSKQDQICCFEAITVTECVGQLGREATMDKSK